MLVRADPRTSGDGAFAAQMVSKTKGSVCYSPAQHLEAAQTLAINPVTVVAAQNVGGAYGVFVSMNQMYSRIFSAETFSFRHSPTRSGSPSS